jgi:AraC-like DNA-binding protein
MGAAESPPRVTWNPDHEAALDLTTTTMPIDVVAHNDGYESRSSFVRAFRNA